MISWLSLKNFLNKALISRPDSCWLWQGMKNQGGYGVVRIDGDQGLAHRAAWRIHHGRDIPSGKSICHTCDNPSCVNPKHLFIGEHADNMKDMAKKGRRAGIGVGSCNGNSKLNESQVKEIKSKLAKGARRKALSEEYNICLSMIDRIIDGKAWKHVQ